MFESIKINIPAEKFTEDVYIILKKETEHSKKAKSSNNADFEYYKQPLLKEDAYYASKALKETYTVIMPTQEQQKTVTCYGTDGKVVTPFEGLYFRTIEEVTEKLDEINNRKVKAVFQEVCGRLISYDTCGKYPVRKDVQYKIKTDNVTPSNFYDKIVEIFGEDFRSCNIIQPWHDFH